MSPGPTPHPATPPRGTMRTTIASCVLLPLLIAGCMDDADSHKSAANPTTSPATAGHEPVIAAQDGDAAKPDNSKRNAADGTSDLTALDQGNSAEDVSITTKIRQAVVADNELSTNAKNVKIITREGVVTLRGPVASVDERTRVGRIAGSLPEVKKVDNLTEAVQ